jgi:hypothetical protein
MARAWQEHGKSMARAEQEHRKNMSITWQQHALTMLWSCSGRMPLTCSCHALARAWQEHVKSMANTWHGTSMARTGQEQGSTLAIAWKEDGALPTRVRYVYAINHNHLFHRSSRQPCSAPMSLLRSPSERCRALRGSKGKMQGTTTSIQIPN